MNRISKYSWGAEGITASGLESLSGLFVDDVALLASSNEDVQLTLEEFAAEFEVFGWGISTSRSEAMVLRWKRVECKISVGDEFRPQVPEFKYIRGLLKKLTVGLILHLQCCRCFTGLLSVYILALHGHDLQVATQRIPLSAQKRCTYCRSQLTWTPPRWGILGVSNLEEAAELGHTWEVSCVSLSFHRSSR